MREEILQKVRELAQTAGGQPPGLRIFERETGIRAHEFIGVYWSRWNDVLKDAGLPTNTFRGALEETFLLEKVAEAARHFGHIPTYRELRMFAVGNEHFPNYKTLSNRFSKTEMISRLRDWVAAKSDFADVAAMLPSVPSEPKERRKLDYGYVYLIASGAHFKIGRSDEIERRVKEIRIALPEAAKLVHSIRTDDPAGIETYWHNRFSKKKRANGEWFKLDRGDVAAFKRRKFQ